MQVNNLYSQVSSKVKFSIVVCRYAASNFVFIQDSTAIPFRHIKPKLLKILFEHHGGRRRRPCRISYDTLPSPAGKNEQNMNKLTTSVTIITFTFLPSGTTVTMP